MKFLKFTYSKNYITFSMVSILTILLTFNSCQKQKTDSIKTENILVFFRPHLKQFESFPHFVSRDIRFFLHNYGDDRFELSHYYNKEKYDDFKLHVNDNEIKFPERKSYLKKDNTADFAKDCQGKNNLLTFKLNDKEELHYNFHFPAEANVKLSTGSAIIPNETIVTWVPDKESTAAIEVNTYSDRNINKHIANAETIPNIGTYTIPKKLFNNMPDSTKITIKFLQGNYLIDEENSVKLVAFSLDRKTWLMYIKQK